VLFLKDIPRFQSNYEMYREMSPDHFTAAAPLISRSTRTQRHFETLFMQRWWISAYIYLLNQFHLYQV